MATFTASPIPSSFGNVLYNPMAVDKAISDMQTADVNRQVGLGTLAINQEKFGLEKQGYQATQDWVKGLGGGAPPTTPSPSGGGGGDSTTETADDLTRAAAVRDGLMARGMQPDGAIAFAANALHESAAKWDTRPGDGGASHGLFQINGPRLDAFKAANGGLLPEQTSLDKQLDFVVSELHGSESTALGRIMGAQGVADKAAQVSEAFLRPKDTVPEMQRRSATALRLAKAWGGQGAAPGTATTAGVPAPSAQPGFSPLDTAAAPPPGNPAATAPAPPGSDAAWLDNQAKTYPGLAGPGGMPTVVPAQPGATPAPSPLASRTGGTDVAGPGAGSGPPASALPPVPAPNQAYQTGLPGITIGLPRSALGPPSGAAGAPAPAAPGAVPGTAPGATAPPGAPQLRPPVPLPQLQPPPPPPNIAVPQVYQSGNAQGLTPQNVRDLAVLASQFPPNPAALEAATRQMRATNISQTIEAQKLQLDYQQRMQEYQKTKYELERSQRGDTPHLVEATRNGVHGQIDTNTGKFEPDAARRMVTLPDGRVIDDQGRVVGFSAPYKVGTDANTGQPMYIPDYPTPGATASPVPGTTPDLGFRKEQEANATRLVELRKDVQERATESGRSDTMIANAEQAMQAAMQGGVPPGALGPAALKLTAMAKAIGVNMAPFGIDPAAVAAGQVTREQLQQLNGAILRKMYPSRITNLDLSTTGSALPNYGLDPTTLEANFEIYKKQNAYDKGQGADMLAYEDAHNGTLRGWEKQWHDKNGYAGGPLDNFFGDVKAGRVNTGQAAGGQNTGGPAQAPIVVKSAADHAKVPSGQLYVAPDGTTRRKP
jgi:hypothetical protein